MLVPLPVTKLFPYTTLFRSKFNASLTMGTPIAITGGLPATVNRAAGPVQGQTGRSIDGSGQAARNRKDRKSTRLNSSHRCISYAFFCLKKKITTKLTNKRSE